MQQTWVRTLGQKDPLEKETATHSNILAWKIPQTEEPGGLQSMGSQRVGHDLVTKPPLPPHCLPFTKLIGTTTSCNLEFSAIYICWFWFYIFFHCMWDSAKWIISYPYFFIPKTLLLFFFFLDFEFSLPLSNFPILGKFISWNSNKSMKKKNKNNFYWGFWRE